MGTFLTNYTCSVPPGRRGLAMASAPMPVGGDVSAFVTFHFPIAGMVGGGTPPIVPRTGVLILRRSEQASGQRDPRVPTQVLPGPLK